jgi:23S rRNA (cytidine2498-2'-O)-methyltransferase
VAISAASPHLFLAEARQGGAEVLERLDEGRLLVRCPEGFGSLFWRHRFPIQAELELPDLDLATVRPFVWDDRLSGELLRQEDYGIQLSAGQRLPWSFAELVETLRHDLGLPPERFRPRSPRVVLSAHLVSGGGRHRMFAGVSRVEENLSPWAAGECRIPRDPQGVSRAENKLLESWEAFAMEAHPDGARALDLGAAPGGWSRLLAGKGYLVDAVDPAELDPRVASLARVRHHRTTSGAFLAQEKGPFDLMVSDMKMDPVRAARLLAGCSSLLRPGRGRLLTTLKLARGEAESGKRGPGAVGIPQALVEAREALQRLSRAYRVLQARQLYFNRSEITVLARPLEKSENPVFAEPGLTQH